MTPEQVIRMMRAGVSDDGTRNFLAGADATIDQIAAGRPLGVLSRWNRELREELERQIREDRIARERRDAYELIILTIRAGVR